MLELINIFSSCFISERISQQLRTRVEHSEKLRNLLEQLKKLSSRVTIEICNIVACAPDEEIPEILADLEEIKSMMFVDAGQVRAVEEDTAVVSGGLTQCSIWASKMSMAHIASGYNNAVAQYKEYFDLSQEHPVVFPGPFWEPSQVWAIKKLGIDCCPPGNYSVTSIKRSNKTVVRAYNLSTGKYFSYHL